MLSIFSRSGLRCGWPDGPMTRSCHCGSTYPVVWRLVLAMAGVTQQRGGDRMDGGDLLDLEATAKCKESFQREDVAF